jgi:hypothetical protein
MRIRVISIVIGFTVLSSSLLGILSSSQAVIRQELTTCFYSAPGKTFISASGKCDSRVAFQENWHLLSSDSSLDIGASKKEITLCSNPDGSRFEYALLKNSCLKGQQSSKYLRSVAKPPAPVISSALAMTFESAKITVDNSHLINSDAPVAYYTVTAKSGVSQKFFTSQKLEFYINGLKGESDYSFQISATSMDGTSDLSAPSPRITTPKYIPPTPAVAISSFHSISVPASIAGSDTSVAINNSTLLNPTISFSSQGSPVSAVFQTIASPGSSSSFTVGGSTSYIDISFPGFSGSATLCFDGLSTDHLWHYTGGSWVDVTTSHPAGKVCGTTSSFSPFTVAPPLSAFTCALGGHCALGETGPGGGLIFYSSQVGFNCGVDWTATGSPAGGLCHYLEVAPQTWNGGSSDPFAYARVNATSLDIDEIPNNFTDGVTGHNTRYGDTADFDYTDLSQLGAGLKFSNLINVADSGTTAARLARSYRPSSGVTDYYLPTLTELNLLCQWSKGNVQVVDTQCGAGVVDPATGLDGDSDYWSSSDKFLHSSGGFAVWVLAIDLINAQYHPKEESFGAFTSERWLVRPIRAF